MVFQLFQSFKISSKYKDIFIKFPDPILVLNEDYQIVFANKKAIEFLEIETGELANKPIDDIISFQTPFVDAETVKADYTTSDGKKILQINISKIKNKEKENIILSLRDITKEHNTIENFEKEKNSGEAINRDKNNFIVKVANELNSPIQSIIGFSQTLLEKVSGPLTEKQEKYLNIIHKNSSELMNLIDKIIDLSKAEADLFKADFKNFDIIDLAKKIFETKKDIILSKKITLNIKYDELEKRIAHSDDNFLKQILSNILDISFDNVESGAVDVVMKNPEIDMIEKLGLPLTGTLNRKSYFQFAIRDYGQGYTRGDLEILCDPYIQLDKQNTKYLQTGLAMVVTKYLVEKLGGTMWIESDVGSGTSFNFMIPIER